jgi:uncharacterized protein
MQAYIEVFFIGVLGSMHCIGMCGGFVTMYALKKPGGTPITYHLLYNAGRITTYSLLGGFLGAAGSFVVLTGEHRVIPAIVLLLAGFIMILMGLNLLGVLGRRGLFEQAGITQTSAFRLMLHRSLDLESIGGIFLFGLLLGFLPCGLLYPIFLTAAASGGFLTGALTMALFGLGTVPALMFLGLIVSRIRPHLKLLLFRIAALLIVLIGLRTFLRGLSLSGLITPGRFW